VSTHEAELRGLRDTSLQIRETRSTLRARVDNINCDEKADDEDRMPIAMEISEAQRHTCSKQANGNGAFGTQTVLAYMLALQGPPTGRDAVKTLLGENKFRKSDSK
jgi:hypothetical protein